MNENWKIRALREKKAKLLRASEEIVEACEREGREPTPAEDVKLRFATDEITQVEAKLQRETELSAYLKSPDTPAVPTGDWPGQPGNQALRERMRAEHGQRTSPAGAGIVGARYATLFGGELSADGWSSYDEFLSVVHARQSDTRLRAMTEGSGVSGGYLVPSQFAAQMLDDVLESSLVLSRATIYPMGSETLTVPGFDGLDHTGRSLYGGVTAQWIGESTDIDEATPKTRKIKLVARKLALLAAASNELADDSAPPLASLVDGVLRKATAWHIDDALLNGTGVGMPRGILNDPALIVVAKETGQAVGTVLYENVIKMLARMHPACFNRSIWLASASIIPQLMQMTCAIGTSGERISTLRESDGQWGLLTRPVFFTEKLPAVGNKGDLVLADCSQMIVGMRKQVSVERSMHVRFTSDQSVWRAITRLDGQGSWNKVATPANGGDTQSWCVTLADRLT